MLGNLALVRGDLWRARGLNRDALEMAAKLRPMRPYWLEEPVWPPEDCAALADIRARGGIPIAAGENAATLVQFRQLFEAGAVDVVQPSPSKMGGVTELNKVFALAAEHGVRVVPHSFYDGPAFLAGDMPKVLATLQEGVQSSEHAAFAAKLSARLKS